MTALALLFTAGMLLELWAILPHVKVGIDYTLYMERTTSWLAGDGFYLPRQLTGQPYPIAHGDATYPPIALWLFVPFVVLPPAPSAVLWWTVPIAIILTALVRLRPAPWTWPILAWTASEPHILFDWSGGNPAMWAFAFLAAGLVLRWPAPFGALKLTLGPFALYGLWRRAWWVGAAGAVLLALPFGGMWLDFATALGNAQPSPPMYGFGYLFGEWPTAAAILLAGLSVEPRLRGLRRRLDLS
jgi:hypothetical protein